MVRVVVPVHHEPHDTVARCVSALQCSTLTDPFEIVLADDSEHDQWQGFAEQRGVGWIRTGARGSAALARNAGARGFEGRVLVFVDADVEVEPQAIGCLIGPVLSGRAEATVGNYTDQVHGMGFSSTYKHLYLATVYARRRGFLRNEFWTALGAVRRDVFERIEGFPRGFSGAAGEDTEFGYRLTTAGHRVLPVNAARATHLKRYTLRILVLNDLRKGSKSAGLLLNKRLPLTGFRHSSRRDIAAVALAVLLAVLLAGSLLASASGAAPFEWSGATLATVGTAYLWLRGDLVRAWARHSAVFLTGAVPLMWALDLVRALSVARVVAGLGRARLGQLSTALRRSRIPPRPRSQRQRGA